MAKRTVGRPPKYTSKEEIEGLIEKYFEDCKGRMLMDGDDEPVLNKFGNPIILDQHPPTVTGLALALGFSGRQALLNYQAKKEFMDTITRAKSLVEKYTEERLFDRDGVNGAKFSLINNFKGWAEKPQTETDVEEQKARVAQIRAQTERIAYEHAGPEDDGVEVINDVSENEEAGSDITDRHTEVPEDIQ